jgi:hypothetical protein
MSIVSVISSGEEIPASYRSVTLLNNLEKFLELTIVTRLSYTIEEHGLLLPRGAKEELRGDGLHLPFKTSQFNKNPNY